MRPQFQFPHSCVCERFIYSYVGSANSAAGKYVDRSWEYINRSQTHERGNWDWGRTIPFLRIHKWDFSCSVSMQGRGQTVLGRWHALSSTCQKPDRAKHCQEEIGSTVQEPGSERKCWVVPDRSQRVLGSARQAQTDKQIKAMHKLIVPGSVRQDPCTVNLQVVLDRADSNQVLPGLRSDRHWQTGARQC